ncbi:hypothetical protein C8J57DRAFT_1435697 [Mycena rebaudengoi]|nr:hypothetical protein C8J57DRAFT_1435697 [Mycena rebaudengoi]
MYKHWSGKIKGLDTGAGDYEIPAAMWDEIWPETADAAWCFWTVYLAPALLKGRFPQEKYYLHACHLSSIIKRCIAFKFTYSQIDILEDDIIDWIEKYEEYYQYDESQLSACPLTIHGWLHIPDDIRFCGPSSTTWSFFMERFCGWLQGGIRSRRYPWANLNTRILNIVYLEQLGCRYDLEAELSTSKKSKSSLSLSEKMFAGSFLEKPRKKNLMLLPEVMPRWGKVHIADGGDSIRNAQRDMSFVRYTISVKDHDDSWIPRVFYGQLEEILECELPEDHLLGELSGKTCLLAVITPCDTSGKDATEEFTDYTHMTAPIVTDLRTVEAVVGRAETQGSWVILDRGEGIVHPVFIEFET